MATGKGRHRKLVVKNNIMAIARVSPNITDASIRKEEKGFIVSYCKKEKPSGGSEYDDPMTMYKTEAFSEGEPGKALSRFMELAGVNGSISIE